MYDNIKYAKTITINEDPEYDSAAKVLEIIEKRVPKARKKFDDSCIRFLEVDKLNNKIIEPHIWLECLSNSRWYGPFLWKNSSQAVLIFHTVTH
jgi:hypothetical protein